MCGITEVDLRRQLDELEVLRARERLVVDDVVELTSRQQRRKLGGVASL
jgi:hypothetical protein